MRKITVLGFSAASLAALVALAIGGTSIFGGSNAILPWSVFGAGGNSSSSTNYSLGSTAGQSSPIGESESTNYRLGAGFWYGIACPDDVDGLTRNEEGPLGTDPCVNDTDNDGCADGEEVGPNETLGGQRDPLYFWDFIDPTRDGNVDFFDFLALLRHYGTTGDPSGFVPDAAEPPTGEYWAAVDRGGSTIPEGNPWDELPPDGTIDFFDFLSLLRQFGHSCEAPP